ncbi:MAG: purine nucleoside permease [Bacteroidota bacterium]|nr:purine nucleoside permease [Bacteroidota bacterium]
MKIVWFLVFFTVSCRFTSDISKKTIAPIPIKVVVVTMFENGNDTGDRPGEFQHWVEKFPLTQTIPFPQGYRDLRYDPNTGVLGMVTGIGSVRATASVMALGMDTRFDLSNAFWLIAGVAGVDPEDASIGSTIWAEWVIDGDMAHEIDARELPADWSTGYFPLGKHMPYQDSMKPGAHPVFHLDTGLVKWAFRLTGKMSLPDPESLRKTREAYIDYPNARKPPQVLMGDELSSMTFWHGELLNTWANKWMKYWTHGQGNFVTSAMEDSGTLQALDFLNNAGKVNSKRVLVLRVASNFTVPPKGVAPEDNLKLLMENDSVYAHSLENAWLVGRKVVHSLLENWPQAPRN